MLVEALPLPLNDNLTIPILSSLSSLAFSLIWG
jgi:dolichol kinase